MSAESTVLQGRVAAELNMLDACTIKRRTGTTTDPNTGQETATYGAPFYTGPCRVRMLSGTGADIHVAQEPATQNQMLVYVPFDSTPAVADDWVTVTDSLDPALVGRMLRVESFYGQTFSVERRYVCEESTSPDA